MADEKTTNIPSMEITIDDGSQRVPIKNKFGEEVGVFYFRPTDISIVDRYNKMVNKFDEIVAPLENISIAPDGGAVDGATREEADALHEAEKRLYQALDYMFGGNMAEAFFGKMHPFSPINGIFYCEVALDAVGKYISAQFERETRKITKDYGIDGYIELLSIPDVFDTKKDAADFFEHFIQIDCPNSPYDCTGRAFTNWYKLVRRRGQFWAYHSVSFDV